MARLRDRSLPASRHRRCDRRPVHAPSVHFTRKASWHRPRAQGLSRLHGPRLNAHRTRASSCRTTSQVSWASECPRIWGLVGDHMTSLPSAPLAPRPTAPRTAPSAANMYRHEAEQGGRLHLRSRSRCPTLRTKCAHEGGRARDEDTRAAPAAPPLRPTRPSSPEVRRRGVPARPRSLRPARRTDWKTPSAQDRQRLCSLSGG